MPNKNFPWVFCVILVVLISISFFRKDWVYDELPAEVKKMGLKTFGSEKSFKEWLRKKNIALGGRKPIKCSSEEIKDMLGRIQHGVYS
jgi:hypothetical protein